MGTIEELLDLDPPVFMLVKMVRIVVYVASIHFSQLRAQGLYGSFTAHLEKKKLTGM